MLQHLKHIMLSENKPDTKGRLQYDFIFMKGPEQQIQTDRK